MTQPDLVWRRARLCDSGHCLEVALPSCDSGACVDVALAGQVHVRDSKRPHAGTLTFDHAAWRDFLGWIRETP